MAEIEIQGRFTPPEYAPAGWTGRNPSALYDPTTEDLTFIPTVRGGVAWTEHGFRSLDDALAACRQDWGHAEVVEE